jgi:hypothetical protein
VPDGNVKWYEPNREEGVVEHNGREYAVSGDEIDNKAKHAGAPVHFDIQRTDAGDIATSVVHRPGSRTEHTSGGVGDLKGAHHPSDKGQDEEVDLNELAVRRRAYGDHPKMLAEDWVRLLGIGDVDRAAELYAPDATIHQGDQHLSGGTNVHRWLANSPLNGTSPRDADVVGDGTDRFTVRWRTLPGDEAAVEVTLRVSDGRITEQWTAEAA